MFVPTKIDDFIGPARKAAGVLSKMAAKAKADGEPLRVLIVGPPGTGKSSLAGFFAGLLGCSKWSTNVFNGTSFRMERVEEAAAGMRYTDLFSDFRLLRIEEVDAMPLAAQTRCLTLLDELPQKTAVVCTSNCEISQLEPRFQSRFLVLQVGGPTADELASFLVARFRLALATAKSIAGMAAGDVRAAINDAELTRLAA